MCAAGVLKITYLHLLITAGGYNFPHHNSGLGFWCELNILRWFKNAILTVITKLKLKKN